MGAPVVSALAYARRGWAVFPCHAPGTRGGCTCAAGASCASPAKHPRTRRGLYDATCDPARIKAWWGAWPGANVGIRTGGGLVVVDVDPAHGGASSVDALEAAHGRLPDTMAVRTGGAGLHLYFAADGPVRNSAGALGPGVDIRGDGGYVVAPPSRHASGGRYRWAGGATLAPLPAWVLEALARPEPLRRPLDHAQLRSHGAASAWAGAALASELNRVAGAPEGQRNHTLNRAAFALGQIVGAGHLDHDEVADLLARAGQCAGLGPREVAATVASGLAAGQRCPRQPAERTDAAGVDLRRVALPAMSTAPECAVAAGEGVWP